MISGSLIQLLDLLPHNGNEDAPIKCETRKVLLEDEPEYEALSYVWGDPAALGVVLVDVGGGSVPVTGNLHCALRRLRLADKTRTLWIDQLCIDQQNTIEKAHQVRLMREIYSSCRTCILWMGEVPADIPVEDAKAVLDLCDYMASCHEAAEDDGHVPPFEYLACNPEFKGPSKAMAVLIGEDETRPEISWWTRIWTVQEAALPPRLDLLWGPLSLPWERLTLASKCWTISGSPGDVQALMERDDAPCMGNFMAKIIWLSISKGRMDSPLYLVYRWRYRLATDPRDKVYALMGLTERGSLPEVEQCSYEVPPSKVFASLTVDMILSEESLLPLVVDPRLEPERASPDIPRWAWDVKYMSNFNTGLIQPYAYGSFRAHGERDLDVEAFKQRMLEEPDVLRIPGARADVVAHVGQPMFHDKRTRMEDSPFNERLNEWEDLGLEYMTNQHVFWEHFARTLLGDNIYNGEQMIERQANRDDLHEVYLWLRNAGGDSVSFSLTMITSNRVFFMTEGGLLGLGHPDTKPGDEIFILNGGNVPFVLTPRKNDSEKEEVEEEGEEKEEDEKDEKEGNGEENEDKDDDNDNDDGEEDEEEEEDDDDEEEPTDYDFVGSCYVHGLMNGEFRYWNHEEPEDRLLRIH